jgi:hypothetical protein
VGLRSRKVKMSTFMTYARHQMSLKMMKPRRRFAGYLIRMGERLNAREILWEVAMKVIARRTEIYVT